MDEISVYDYLKFKINPKNWGKEILPDENPELLQMDLEEDSCIKIKNVNRFQFLFHCFSPNQRVKNTYFDYRYAILSLVFAIAGQMFLEPLIVGNNRNPWIGAALYILSAISLILGTIFPKKGSDRCSVEIEEDVSAENGDWFSQKIRLDFFAVSLILALITFFLFGNNQFTIINCTLWITSIIFGLFAFSESDGSVFSSINDKLSRVKQNVSQGIFISPWSILCIVVFLVCVFFHFYQLDSVPLDMYSDHAEKLYDIMDIQDGKTPIFFIRNTGREAFQFYWTILIIKIFGTGISFLSLKIGTAFAGLFVLPYIYQLGKLIGNRWVGLITMFLFGTAYWQNVIDRVALRYAFYPMFTAPVLYYLFKGLIKKKRSSLIACGCFLGIGLQGYTSFRIVPLLVTLIAFLFFIYRGNKGSRKNFVLAFLVLIFFAILLFLPLLRVMTVNPEAVLFRSFSRIGESETTFLDNPIKIFFMNLWKALVMPFWNDGEIWAHSIVFRPSLDHITGAFFFLGIGFIIVRLIRKYSWQDASLLLSIPFLMLPSILSLAFPKENPCLNRTAAAAIPIFIVAAIGFCVVFENIFHAMKNRMLPIGILFAISIFGLINIGGHNFDLIFTQYNQDYQRNSLNTKQIGEVIKGFAASEGTYDDAYVIPYPYWVDTRLVGITADAPHKDYALDRSLLESVEENDRPQLFIYKADDHETRSEILSIFPDGVEILNYGPYNSKNFFAYYVTGE